MGVPAADNLRHHYTAPTLEAQDALVDAAADLLDAIAALHVETWGQSGLSYCEHCGDVWAWPCPTARLLQGEGE